MKWKTLIAALGAFALAGCGGMDEDYLNKSAIQSPVVIGHKPIQADFYHYWQPEGDCTNKADGESCSDGVWCNGLETCLNEACTVGTAPCDTPCDEDNDICAAECVYDSDCDDDIWCNGLEWCCTRDKANDCEKYYCHSGESQCGPKMWAPFAICDEVLDTCRGCYTAEECDDGYFCTGREVCSTMFPWQGVCLRADELPPCVGENELCDEEWDRCYLVPPECEYDYQCELEQYCDENGKCQDW